MLKRLVLILALWGGLGIIPRATLAEDLPEARYMGFQDSGGRDTQVKLPPDATSTTGTYMFLFFTAAIAIGVMFKNAKRIV